MIGAGLAELGYGPAYAAGYRSLALGASQVERAGLVAAILVVAYLAFSVPALTAGLAVTQYGLRDTTFVFGAALTAVACVAVALSLNTEPR